MKMSLTRMSVALAMAGLVLGLGAGCAHCKICSSKAGPEKQAPRAVINTQGLKALLATGSKMVLLDARTGKYDDGQRIPGAASLAPTATAEQAAALIPDKDALVVTYCASLQCPASRQLAARLKELGYKNVIEYPEGIAGWTAAGNETRKSR